MSKKEFVLSKFLTVFVFAASSAVFVFLMSLILGLRFSSYTGIGIIFSELEYILAYFVKLMGFFSFCLFLGILIKRSAFALGFLLIWNIVEGIISGLISFKLFPEGNTASYITMFLPLESMSNLIVEPFTRLSFVKTIGTQIGVTQFKDYGVHWYGILIVVMWILIFMLLSYKLLQKRDL
jgi:ABC-type transport system involved in multi-copper enzyme maturation permease subunit